jgi:hypothetical protein
MRRAELEIDAHREVVGDRVEQIAGRNEGGGVGKRERLAMVQAAAAARAVSALAGRWHDEVARSAGDGRPGWRQLRCLDHAPDCAAVEAGAGQHGAGGRGDQAPAAGLDMRWQPGRHAAVADRGADQKHVGHGPEIQAFCPAEQHAGPGYMPAAANSAKRRRQQTEAQERQNHTLQPGNHGQQRPALRPYVDDTGAEPGRPIHTGDRHLKQGHQVGGKQQQQGGQ